MAARTMSLPPGRAATLPSLLAASPDRWSPGAGRARVRARGAAAPGWRRRTRRSTCTSIRRASSRDVPSAWSSTGDLGHVQGGQYGGYLFPMGPFFALGHALGLAPWLVQRLWLGLVLTLAAWGAVKLMDGCRRPAGRARRGAALSAQPVRGRVRRPHVDHAARPTPRCRGCCCASTAGCEAARLGVAGGVRADRHGVRRRRERGGDSRGCCSGRCCSRSTRLDGAPWRALCGLRLARRARHGARRAVVGRRRCSSSRRYGVDFLRFTEQPGTIWATTSLPESLRLMGYWVSYLGVGYCGHAAAVLRRRRRAAVRAAGRARGAARARRSRSPGFAWTRRRRYAPFCLLLVLVGLLVMIGGLPGGHAAAPRRELSPTTTSSQCSSCARRYKAGPLVALGMALLGGLAAAQALGGGVRCSSLGAALVVALAGRSSRGRALDDQLTWERVPRPGSRRRGTSTRRSATAAPWCCPGSSTRTTTGAGRSTRSCPRSPRRPSPTRNAVRYADLRATDLLWTIDALVQQRRALPGQLAPLLDLMGARTVVTGADDDRARSGAVPAAEAADVLDRPGLGRPAKALRAAARSLRAAPPGTLGARRERCRRCRAWDLPRRAPAWCASRARSRAGRAGRRRLGRRRSPGSAACRRRRRERTSVAVPTPPTRVRARRELPARSGARRRW